MIEDANNRMCVCRKVIIIGVSYSSRLSLVRSIGILGCDITVVAWFPSKKISKTIDGYSKFVNRVFLCKKEEKAFIQLLKEKCTAPNQKVVLVPDCDFSVAVIDSHQNELAPYFVMPHIKHCQGAIVEWSDKNKQKELAAKFGMNVAKSEIIEIKEGEFVIPENIQYPCFPKPLASVAGGKAGMKRCNNRNDLEESLHEIIRKKTANARVMVEEYKQINKEFAVVGFSDGNEVSIPGVIQFIEGSKTQKGIALQGKIMPIKGFEGIIEQFKSFVREIGLVGLFDIDFYECQGILYFSELNIRYGGSGYAVVKMGVNLPAMLVECLSGTEVRGMEKYVEKEAIYTNERICWNDLQNGLISIASYLHYIKTADILFIKDEHDNAPYKAFRKKVGMAMIKGTIKRILLWNKQRKNVS